MARTPGMLPQTNVLNACAAHDSFSLKLCFIRIKWSYSNLYLRGMWPPFLSFVPSLCSFLLPSAFELKYNTHHITSHHTILLSHSHYIHTKSHHIAQARLRHMIPDYIHITIYYIHTKSHCTSHITPHHTILRSHNTTFTLHHIHITPHYTNHTRP